MIGMAAVVLISAQVLWIAVHAGAGLLALVALVLSSWVGLRALPHLGQWAEARLLQVRLASSRDNPIAELLNQLTTRSAQLARYRNGLANIAAQIEGLRDLLEQRREAAPGHDTRRQAAALHKMLIFHAHHTKQLAAAELALANYKRHLTAKRFEWQFAQAGNQVLTSLDSAGHESIVQELLEDEASHSVHVSFHRVFASLDAELDQLEAQPAFEPGAERT